MSSFTEEAINSSHRKLARKTPDKRKLSKKIYLNRKNIHIRVIPIIYKEYRKVLIDYGVSNQDIIEYFMALVIENDTSALDIIDRYLFDFETHNKKKFMAKEVEEIYDLIEKENDDEDE